MLGEKDGTAMVTQEEASEVKQRPGRKAPFLWRGLALFLYQETNESPPEQDEVFGDG